MEDEIRPKALLIPFDKFALLDLLDPVQYKRVITGMRRYVEFGEEPDNLALPEQMAFEAARPFMDSNISAYQRKIQAQRENGRKGGRKKQTTETHGFPSDSMGAKIQNSKAKTKTDANASILKNETTAPDSRVNSALAEVAQYFQRVVGEYPPSANYKLTQWLDVFPPEVLCAAFDEAAERGKRSWKYVDGILRGWQADGVRTLGDVDARREARKKPEPTLAHERRLAE